MAKETDSKPLTNRDTPVVVSSQSRSSSCCGYNCIRVLVILYAILYLLIGLILAAVGAWVVAIKKDFESVSDAVTNPAVVALVAGIIIIITSFIGIIGAVGAKRLLLKIFFVVAILVFLLQIVVGILAFVYRNEALNLVNDRLHFAIDEYTNDEDVRNSVDKIQSSFECCGVERARDWDKNSRFSCRGQQSGPYFCGVPDSCCREMSDQCGGEVRKHSSMSRVIYLEGCSYKFQVWLANNLDLVGGVGLGLALLHVLGIFAVYWFITKIEDRCKLFRYKDRHYEDY